MNRKTENSKKYIKYKKILKKDGIVFHLFFLLLLLRRLFILFYFCVCLIGGFGLRAASVYFCSRLGNVEHYVRYSVIACSRDFICKDIDVGGAASVRAMDGARATLSH